MTVLIIMVAAGAFLFLGGRFYAPVIGKVLGEKADRVTPAVKLNDGRDYVPTKTPVVFAHHFASIAGAGPIVGPVLAIIYGWGPALLWILLGGVFLGAVHDFVATHLAVREGGKNLTVVARRYIGPSAFVLMLVLLISLLVLVCAAFLDLSATALTSKVALKDLELESGQSMFREMESPHIVTGETMTHAIIGGVASTSVVVITMFSPLIGFLYLKRKLPVWICSLLAVGICIFSIWIGIQLPMAVSPQTWKIMISAYVLISAGLPVWLFLQSRDFINVHILYVGMAFLVVTLLAAAIRGGGAVSGDGGIPISYWSEAGDLLDKPGWPAMFVIIACGAVSGFHSLCAGGTTCKQLNSELSARRVGYYGMLLESFLAVCVIGCLIVGLSLDGYKGYCYPGALKGNVVLTFAMAVGHTASVGLGLPVAYGALGAMLLLEGFLVTTLDTAIRLTRYMIEEGWATFFGKYDVFAEAARQQAARVTTDTVAVEIAGTGGLTIEEPPHSEPQANSKVIATSGIQRQGLQLLRYYWVNSGIAVALMLLLGWGKGYKMLWDIFGSSNQLLAALALLVATTWLLHHRRTIWYTLLPALFMLVTSITMMVRLLVKKFIPGWPATAPLAVADILILVLTIGILGLTVRRWIIGSEAKMMNNEARMTNQ
jgi:carbon starvation protein